MFKHPSVMRTQTLADGVLVRPIRAEDDPAVGRIIREVMTEFSAVGEGFSIQDPEVARMSKAYASGQAIYYVLDEGGRVLGGAGIGPLPEAEKDVCELKKMYVLRAGRNRGFGRALMERCLEEAPMGATGHFGCDRWFLKVLSAASPLTEGDRWVEF
jgi:putative acetyltransferase